MARYDIAIGKSADALDEVQFATERELAIRNQDTCGGQHQQCRRG